MAVPVQDAKVDSCYFQVKDPSFCARCGCVLPLPTAASSVVKCRKCQLDIDIAVFHEHVVHRCIEFNKVVQRDSEDSINYKNAGPSIDRTCNNCGHPSMTYKTQQTRSADEGQTVFYNCPECGNQEIEYS